jgi:hypothetical protein
MYFVTMAKFKGLHMNISHNFTRELGFMVYQYLYVSMYRSVRAYCISVTLSVAQETQFVSFKIGPYEGLWAR